MLNVLLQGSLTSAPVRRTSGTGRVYATATIRVPTEEEALLASVIVFEKAAVAALLKLGKGAAAAVAGTAKLSHWTGRDGVPHVGLSVVGQEVLSVYAARRKRQGNDDDEGVSRAVRARARTREGEPVAADADDLPWQA